MKVRDLGSEPAGDSGLTVRQMLAADIASSVCGGLATGGGGGSGLMHITNESYIQLAAIANNIADALIESWKETK